MKNRRLIVAAIGVVLMVLFASIISSDVEFFAENYVDHWDLKLVSYLALTGIGAVLSVALVIVNKFFGRHMVMSVLIICLFLGVRSFPIHLSDYRKLLIPMSYAELRDLSHLKVGLGEGDIVYIYRSDCADCQRFRPRMIAYLKEPDTARDVAVSIAEFDLTKIRTEMAPKRYAALTKRLGVRAVPALISSYRDVHKSSKPYSVTFNGINDKKRFAKMKMFLKDNPDKISGPGIVYRQK